MAKSKPPATAAQKLTYLKHKGLRCLFCESRNLHTETPQVSDGGLDIRCYVGCGDCKRAWTDVYVLKSVEPYEDA